MKIEVDLLQGQKLQASFGEHSIVSDQSVQAGGDAEHPEPFDYFAASMPLCAAFFMRKFCEQREISTQGMRVIQETTNVGDDKFQKRFSLKVVLPDGFPEKYRKALLAAANSCTVKKVIQNVPEFEIEIAN